MIDTALRYFAQPGPTTNLSSYSDLVRELPSEPEALAKVVRGLIIHEGVVAHLGLQYSQERFADRTRVGASAILERVLSFDRSPLGVERPVQNRMIGYCYHFAVLHCAFLRSKAVPARARCGFGAYFREDAWIDHWVVEYWDGGDWVIIDPDSGRDVVSAADFRYAGLAWQRCRDGDADPARHGNHVLWGWDELRGSLVNDVGAHNRVEVGEWSWCELIAVEHRDRPAPELDARLDTLARLLSSDAELEELQRLYGLEEGLQPPPDLFGG